MAIGLLFSGQGAQKVGMGSSLYENSATVRALYDEANATLGYDFKKVCFEGPDATLTQTSVCQPALYVQGYAIYKILLEAGKLQGLTSALGLSLGELTALAVAGAVDFATGLRVVAERGRLMQQACDATKGGMASLIGGSFETAEALCKEFEVDVSNLNCPGQVVVSGEQTKIDALVEKAKGLGLFKMVVPLKVAGAYHSRLMQSAADSFATFLKGVAFSTPQLTVYTNVTGKQVSEPEDIKQMLVKQVVSTVRWEDCLRSALASGTVNFYECGPGGVLTGMAKRTDKALQVTPLDTWADIQSLV